MTSHQKRPLKDGSILKQKVCIHIPKKDSNCSATLKGWLSSYHYLITVPFPAKAIEIGFSTRPSAMMTCETPACSAS